MTSSRLTQFRQGVENLMASEYARPFTCSGSPLDCKLFLVGLNSATPLKRPFFERYWNDTEGFLRDQFEADYGKIRKKQGVRPRIEAFVNGAAIPCLETNIYAVPTPKSTQLRKSDKDPRVFEYMLREIRPDGIVIHSNKPIEYFRKFAGEVDICQPQPVVIKIEGRRTHVLGLPGPLFTRGIDCVREIGSLMKKCIGA